MKKKSVIALVGVGLLLASCDKGKKSRNSSYGSGTSCSREQRRNTGSRYSRFSSKLESFPQRRNGTSLGTLTVKSGDIKC